VKFRRYPARTWVRGAADIITEDTHFDSTQRWQNDYTALLSDECCIVVKIGHYSRVVSVQLPLDGTSGQQVALTCSEDGRGSGEGRTATGQPTDRTHRSAR